jgi:LacI family transcriptional regulator
MPKKNSDNKMTISEFSRTIGLSTATISSVLNNQNKKRGISDDTVQLVRSQARRFGYRPNMSAKKLRSQSGKLRSFDIAVVTSFEVPMQFTLGLMHAIEKIASQERYKNYSFSTQIVMYHAGKIFEMAGMLDESRFNGAIVTNTIAEDDKFFMENEISYPVVFLGRYLPKYNCVTVDVNMAGKMAANVLLGNCRCTKPVVLIPDVLTQATNGRLDGFRKECGRQNIECKIIEAKGFLEEGGYTALMEYIKNGGQIDGLYSVFETLAIGAYHAIKQNGLRIPDDVAVIETGETSVCRYMEPPMSSFSQSETNMHEAAVEMLLDQLLGNNEKVINRILPSIPVLRESTNRFGKNNE